VLPGASIGVHCVIGANSVVLSDIPDYSVAVGSPARVVKMYNRSTKRWERV
jgi:acetyltransferase-like isoleucine patch superfamily enzyme